MNTESNALIQALHKGDFAAIEQVRKNGMKAHHALKALEAFPWEWLCEAARNNTQLKEGFSEAMRFFTGMLLRRPGKLDGLLRALTSSKSSNLPMLEILLNTKVISPDYRLEWCGSESPLSHGCAFNVPLLFCAINKKNFAAAHLLLDHGADPTLRARQGNGLLGELCVAWTAEAMALEYGQAHAGGLPVVIWDRVIEAMESRRPLKSGEVDEALKMAALSQSPRQTIEWLLKKGANPLRSYNPHFELSSFSNVLDPRSRREDIAMLMVEASPHCATLEGLEHALGIATMRQASMPLMQFLEERLRPLRQKSALEKATPSPSSSPRPRL